MHFLILGTAAAVVLALGLQAPNEDGRPPAYQSVLLVTGLLLLFPALLRLSATLGAEDFGTRLPGRRAHVDGAGDGRRRRCSRPSAAGRRSAC